MLAAADTLTGSDHPQAILLGSNPSQSADTHELDLIELHNGKPSKWIWFAQDQHAFEDYLTRINTSNDTTSIIQLAGFASISNETTQALAGCIKLRSAAKTDATEHAAQQSARLLEGPDTAWIDLRTDQLAIPHQYEISKRPLAALITATLVLLVSISITTHWRASHYQSITSQYIEQQIDTFRTAFPEQRVPNTSNIRGRLLSEKRKLTALLGQESTRSNDASTPPPSALDQLEHLLAGLPSDIRYRILELSIVPDQITINGEARKHSDAERIASSLRSTGHFQVNPPRTDTLNTEAVTFDFTATHIASEAIAQGER